MLPKSQIFCDELLSICTVSVRQLVPEKVLLDVKRYIFSLGDGECPRHDDHAEIVEHPRDVERRRYGI